MPWEPLPQIAFAVATYPFQPSAPSDLPLELGDELYIIEQGGKDGQWYRGYLVAPPSLLAGLTSVKGQTLEARVFSGIFPKCCVDVREVLGNAGSREGPFEEDEDEELAEFIQANGLTNGHLGDDLSRDGSRKGSRKGSSLSKRAVTKKVSEEPPLSPTKSLSRDGSHKKNRLMKAPSHRSNRSKSSQHSILTRPSRTRDPDAPRPPAPVPMLKIGDETPTSLQEPLVDEIASCLREWHSCNLHELLLARQYPLLEKFSSLVQDVDLSRRQLLHNVLTNHELRGLRERTVWDLVRGNKMLSGEVIVRDPAERGRMLTGDDSAVDITRLQSMMSLLDAPPIQPPDTVSLHHVLVNIKSVSGTPKDPTTLVCFLSSKTPGTAPRPVSEAFTVDLPSNGSLHNLGQLENMKTLFIDLSAADIGESTGRDAELFLVVKVLSKKVAQSVLPGGMERQPSRDGPPSRSDSRGGLTTTGKSGRMSLMWGRNNTFGSSSNSTATQGSIRGAQKLQPLTENAGSSLVTNGHPQAAPTGAKWFVKRPVAVGVLRLGPLARQEKETEQTMRFWTPTGSTVGDQDTVEGWDDIIKELLQSRSGQFDKSTEVEQMQLHVAPFISPDADSLIKKTPTLLQNIITTSKIGFSGAPTKPRSDIYLTISEAFLPRHALLSHPRSGSTPISQNLATSNLQLTLEVRNGIGDRIESCIIPSSNGTGVTTWRSNAVERGQPFGQTIRLAISPDEVPGSHVFMSLADAPDGPFALAWMPLWDQQAFMRDGHHSLLLYKYDELTSSPTSTSSAKGGYLSLPWNSRGKDDVSKDEAVTGPVATLRMHSFLCSTKFSQDKVLLGLLRWREKSTDEVGNLLRQVVFVPEIELVKLLSDVFDALFGILVEQAGNEEYEDLVFNALTTVLGIVHDRRFNLGPLVDQYAEYRFNYPFATPCLIRSFQRLLSNPTDSNSSRKLRATFKVGKHILKFIINARAQQKVKEAGIGITSTQPTFTRELQNIFKALESLMRNPSPILVGSQTLAVQHFHTWLPELNGLLSTEDILHIAVDFIDSCSTVKGKLILYKLILIIHYSKLDLFSQAETRRALIVNTVRWLASYWGKTDSVTQQWRDQVRLCCSVVSTQIHQLGAEVSDYIQKVVESYRAIQATERKEKDTLSLLFPTAYPFPTKQAAGQPVFDEALIELAAILAAMSSLPTGIHLDLHEDELSEFLSEALEVHKSIISGEAFPNSWLSVHVFHHKSTMQTLEHLAGILVDSFLPHPDDADNFNTDLWRTFFTTLLRLVGSDALALETFPEQKRRAVWKIAGDVREHGADLLRRTWESIGWETSAEDRRRYGLEKMGGYQVQYVPALVAPIVELCLSVHEGLRSVAVEVLQTMIVSEWTLSQDLSVVQAEMIDCLDKLFKSKNLTESITQKRFLTELNELFDPLSHLPEDSLYVAFKDLTATMDEFLGLLVAVHSTDNSSEVFHITHTLRLMEFLRDMQKEDIFIRYVHQLARIQSDSRNPVEAGLALKLHADLYEWDSSKNVPALEDPPYAEQTAFERKELIYFEMIRFYEDGKCWDNALVAYKELANEYEHNVFEFAKLARTQKAMAKIHEAIAKGERQIPRYFRVVYRGLGFPLGLRDKQFIFEGSPSERMAAFTDRMQQQHPSARIIKSEDIEDVEGQYLEISPVSPHKDLFHPVYQRAKIPQPIREHMLSVRPKYFSITSRRMANSPEVKDHFVEKTIYTTAENFPTILQRSEIVAAEEVRLSPIQSAIERTVRKTQELAGFEKKINEGSEDFSPVTDALSTSVDPLTPTSVARYRELLPQKREINEYDDDDTGEDDELPIDPLENALRIALLDHAMVIKRCLGLYAKSTSPSLQVASEDLTQSKPAFHRYSYVHPTKSLHFAPGPLINPFLSRTQYLPSHLKPLYLRTHTNPSPHSRIRDLIRCRTRLPYSTPTISCLSNSTVGSLQPHLLSSRHQ